MEHLAEKIEEYENTIFNLKSQLEHKNTQNTILESTVNSLNTNITELTMELERQNETITHLTDQYNSDMQEKEQQFQYQKESQQLKHEKELMLLKNNELNNNDREKSLREKLEEAVKTKQKISEELDYLRKSSLTSVSRCFRI